MNDTTPAHAETPAIGTPAGDEHEITQAALAARGLVKRFPTFTLEHVDLDVPRGYVVGLVGANGSGKSTTIGSLIGTVIPDEGRLAVPTMDRVGVVLDSHFFMARWTPPRSRLRCVRSTRPGMRTCTARCSDDSGSPWTQESAACPAERA